VRKDLSLPVNRPALSCSLGAFGLTLATISIRRTHTTSQGLDNQHRFCLRAVKHVVI